MDETDVGRVLAAAAPEAVPPVGDLSARARTLGRRRRLHRAALQSGGAGIGVAAVVGAVVALGGFGTGSGHPGNAVAPGAGTKSALSPAPTTGAASSSPPVKPTFAPPGQTVDDPVADAKVLAAVRAALPAADRDKLTLFRAAGTKLGYGAEYSWGPKSAQAVLAVSVASFTPEPTGDTPTMCASDLAHCTKGTATLRGHRVRWEYYYGDLGNPGLNVYDDQAAVDYLVTAYGPVSKVPGLAEMKGVGLNEKVASELLAAWPK